MDLAIEAAWLYLVGELPSLEESVDAEREVPTFGTKTVAVVSLNLVVLLTCPHHAPWKHRLQRAVVFKIPKWMIGKELPGTVICRKGEPEAECSVDLTSHLKRGDRIRIGMGIFKIPTEGGFRRPDPDLDNMATIPNGGDVDPDTGLVKDAPPRFNHLFLPMDRPWAILNEEQIKVYKISSRRPREPSTTKIGKAWDAVSFLFSDESVPKQMAVGAKAGIQGVIAKVTTKIGKTTTNRILQTIKMIKLRTKGLRTRRCNIKKVL